GRGALPPPRARRAAPRRARSPGPRPRAIPPWTARARRRLARGDPRRGRADAPPRRPLHREDAPPEPRKRHAPRAYAECDAPRRLRRGRRRRSLGTRRWGWAPRCVCAHSGTMRSSPPGGTTETSQRAFLVVSRGVTSEVVDLLPGAEFTAGRG